MTIRGTLSAPSRSHDLALRDDFTPDAQSRAFAAFARDDIAAARQHNARVLGMPPRLTITVDGRAGAQLASVKPTGAIVAEFEIFDEMLREIAQALVDASPVRSGEYVRGHRLFADGREVHVTAGQPVPPAEEYVFLNTVPYARKIEVGRTKSGRPFVVTVPPHVYERVQQWAARRFGNIASIRFAYRAPIGGAIAPYVSVSRGSDAATRMAATRERYARQPAIVINARGRG